MHQIRELNFATARPHRRKSSSLFERHCNSPSANFNSDYLKGVMTFTKGIYYVGLTIISIIQVFLTTANVAELALGFTLSLAIFESVTALDDGYKNMKKSK